MRLTIYTDYSLRLLMYLAVKQDGLCNIAEVADHYGISNNHLVKVAHFLGKEGYITTVRGKNGGLRLARDPADINVGEVVRKTEPDMALVMCFEPVHADCPIMPSCVLKSVLYEARSAFFAVLDRRTLADLARPREELRALLHIEQIAPARTAPA